MFEFFIALFGSIYYGDKYLSDRRITKAADTRIQKSISDIKYDHERWVNSVVDDKLEREVNMLDLIVLQNMHQRIATEAKLGAGSVSRDMVIMGVLAQKAKIPRKFASTGFRSAGIWDYAEQQRWQEQRRFLVWYDNELRRNGLQEPLLFVDGVNEKHIHTNIALAKPVAECSQMIKGRYFWKSMRFWVG